MTIYTDQLISKLDPKDQISGIIDYNDQITEAEKAKIAQKVGQALGISGAAGADGASLNRFVDATFNAFTEAHVHRYLYIAGSANGNDGFYRITKLISSSEVELSSNLAASETGLAWSLYQEPNLEDDVNLALTQLREIIDPANPYFQNMPRAFNPADTDAVDVKNEKLSMKVLADNWYGTHTKIVDILFNNAGAGYTVGNGSQGVLLPSTLSYADPVDRRGWIIQDSVAGTYYDEVALASITRGLHKVTLVDILTGNEFFGSNGSVVYGVLQDGLDSGIAESTELTFSQAGAFYDVVGAAKAIQLYASGNAGHYFWLNVTDGANTQTDPTLVGTGHQVDVLAGDTTAQVATKVAAVIDAVAAFGAPAPAGSIVVATNAGVGSVTDASSVDAAAVAVLAQGVDNGTGEGTDVYVKFVHDVAGVPTEYTMAASDPSEILIYAPNRKRRIELLEYDERRTMVGDIVGDAELVNDIGELRVALGIADGETNWDLTNLTSFFPFSELGGNPSMEDIVNKLNEEIGNRDFTSSYLVDGQSVTDSLNALGNAIEGAGVKSKILEDVLAPISAGTVHTIPFASGTDPLITTYKLDPSNNGLFMDVYVNGNKVTPDSVTVNREYSETSNTQVTFRFSIKKGAVIEYVIRDNA